MFAMTSQRQCIPSDQYRGGADLKSSGEDSRAAVIEGLKNGLASGLATACAKLLLQPFDTLKTVQQVGPCHCNQVAISCLKPLFYHILFTYISRAPRVAWVCWRQGSSWSAAKVWEPFIQAWV